MTVGGLNSLGLGDRTGGPDLAGELGPESAVPGNCRVARLGRSLGLVLGTGGGSLGVHPSHNLSGLGAGEMVRGGGGPVAAGPLVLFMFSNWARSEDTGFYGDIRLAVSRNGQRWEYSRWTSRLARRGRKSRP